MSVLFFGIIVVATTLLASFGYALMLSIHNRSINQQWVLLEIILATITSFGLIVTSVFQRTLESPSHLYLFLALQIVAFGLSIFAFFTARSPKWALDTEVVKRIKWMSYGLFTVSIVLWTLLVLDTAAMI